MSDSNLTKRMIAQTLKLLMRSQPFEKISVSDICNACEVSRKTFYYHFQDKFALTEWIFDTEVTAAIQKGGNTDRFSVLDSICRYFYQERKFYADLFQYTGQNSFRQYFQEFMFQTLENYVLPATADSISSARPASDGSDELQMFFLHFVSDAILVSVFRWITGGCTLPPDQFISRIRGVRDILTTHLQREGLWDEGIRR